MSKNENILELISEHVFQFNKVDENLEVATQPAIELIFNPLRFDLMFKYIYVLSIFENIELDWYKELYKEHIKYFNNFQEDNFPEKKTSNDFLNAYNSLIEVFNHELHSSSMYTIPVDKTRCPLDGAHRLAILAAKKLDVNTILLAKRFPLTCYIFNYEFFVKKGMPSLYSDFVALEYARLSSNSYIICLFPSCIENWTIIDRLIKERVNIYYEKQISLSPLGKLNFTINLYRNEPWLGNHENDFEGAKYKMKECFSKEGNLKVYLINSDSLEQVKSLKQEIRDICKIGNHSVHSTDTKSITLELAAMVFNNNTIDYINSVQNTSFHNFKNQFTSFKDYIKNKKLDANKFCIDGSAVMAACNLRDCYDLDFLYAGNERELIELPEKVDCHNNYLIDCEFDKLLGLSINDIIFNPKYHFYYEGYKVMNPELIRKIKEYRNEPKDIKDVQLLNGCEKRIAEQAILKIENNVPSEWYSTFDKLLKAKTQLNKIPTIYLNSRFSISANVKILLEYWQEYITPMQFTFNESDYFYTFELYQVMDSSYEIDFWNWYESKVSNTNNLKEVEDIFIFVRICFSFYIKENIAADNSIEDFRKTFHDFLIRVKDDILKSFRLDRVNSEDKVFIERFLNCFFIDA